MSHRSVCRCGVVVGLACGVAASVGFARGFPGGISAGDVTSESVMLWARTDTSGSVMFEVASDAAFASIVSTMSVAVTDVRVPGKVEVGGLLAGATYYYRATDGASAAASGRFRTASSGARTGLRFGVSGDWRGELSPYPSVSNVASKELDFFVALGDTIYADVASPSVPVAQCVTIEQFRDKHLEGYGERHGQSVFAGLRASTAWFANIDDHEVTNDFAGGAPASSDPRFGGAGLINDHPLYETGLLAFQEYNPVRDEFWTSSGDPRTDGERRLYRSRVFGRDAAIHMLDARSFRDEELPGVTDPLDPVQVQSFLAASFDPTRTMLGRVQVERLKADLLAAKQAGVTWQFVLVPEPIQNLGVILASDRFEGYAAERTEILHFVRSNDIRNVVFVAADIHGTVVNNLTYSFGVGEAQLNANAFEVVTGSVAYAAPFGPTVAGLVASSGYSSGKLTAVYDAYDYGSGDKGRRWTYTYGSGRLTQVKVELKTNATWASPGTLTEVGRVDYTYSGSDLETVTITLPLTDAGVSWVRKKHYRYWSGTFNASTNPGHPHAIQYVVDFEGYRRADWAGDNDLDDDPLTMSETNLKPYAAYGLEYDASHRVSKAWMNGECGCGGGANGTHEFTYETSSGYATDAADTSYQSALALRTIVKKPGVGGTTAYDTVYFDETGMPLARLASDGVPSGGGSKWATQAVRDSSGRVTEVRTPAANSAYDHTNWAFTASASVGLIHVFDRETSGDLTGLPLRTRWKIGTGGSSYVLSATTYESRQFSITDTTVTLVLPSTSRSYHTETTDHTTANTYDQTTMSYTYWGGTNTSVDYLRLKTAETTHPIVSTAKNGPNAATSRKAFLLKDGRTVYTLHEDGVYDHADVSNGLPLSTVRNVSSDAWAGPRESILADPSNWSITLPSGVGSPVVASGAYDAQGRSVTASLPNGRVTYTYHSKLKDGRSVTISIPRRTGTPGSYTYFGPASYTVSNQAGKAEFTGSFALSSSGITTATTGWIDETDADPITALDIGTLARMSTTILNASGGRVDETRVYFAIPGSGGGTEGTHYDATRFGYDGLGRKTRMKSPTGTIMRTEHDALGRTVRQWTGTNDTSFSDPDGEPSGTDDMVKLEELTYDAGSAGGNSLVTKRATDPDGDWGTTTDRRETTFSYDARGRQLLTTNPIAPHNLVKLDNLGRTVASARYTSTASITVGTTDPAGSATNDKANRVDLSETFYDEKGRVWKTLRHKINQSTGASEDTLPSLSWYDEEGRVVKVQGETLAKTRYDRLGRVIRQFTLAKDDDASYTDATGIGGDIVLEEQQTAYESDASSNVLMRVTISRRQGDNSTTGSLDAGTDSTLLTATGADMKGRPQIVAMWHDALDRVTDTVAIGTNGIVGDGSTGGGDYARASASTPPARSDTAIRSTTTYNDDGSVLEFEDPRGMKTRYAADALGRRTLTIANYVNGTPSGVNAPDDVHTRVVYANGQQTKLWVDLDGDNVEDADDQVTTYTYGTVKGTGAGQSAVASGHLLRVVTYPDSGGSSDVVTHTYNALSEPATITDQSGNVIAIDHDALGRETHRRVTTLISGFDGAVRRISTTYLPRGLRESVTQYDNAAVGTGSVVNDVKYTYDAWGMPSKYEEDRDSLVGSGTANDYEVGYAYEKAGSGGGRQTLRRTSMTTRYASTDLLTTTMTYTDEESSSWDDLASRVSTVKVGAVTVAMYGYLGTGHLVETSYPEASAYSKVTSSTAGVYPGLDRFNRITQARWTKDLSTDQDFYAVDYTYDRASNITSQIDAYLKKSGGTRVFDAAFSVDGLNRLSDADEGEVTSGSISTRARRQLWTLSQTGNWALNRLDLNGDGVYTGTNELDDTGTFNKANELTARDTDSNATNDYTLSYDAVGNLTDDGKDYLYVYDAFGRLRFIKKRSNSDVVEEFVYNGLNHRVGWHYDADASGTVDGSDPWYYMAYDMDWRQVGVYRGADTSPKELFVHHMAGPNGAGGASAIDAVILRERDSNSGWTSAADGTLEERLYFCQVPGTRGDVVALLSSSGQQRGQMRYSAYGVPFGMPAGDLDADGDCDFGDLNQIASWISTSTYDVRADMDLDGDVDATDQSILSSLSYGTTLGRGKLAPGPASASGGAGVRRGYAGYEHDGVIFTIAHVRNRVLLTELGRWTRRDPLGYVDGMSLYEYVASRPATLADAFGFGTIIPGGGGQIPGIPGIPGGGTYWDCYYACIAIGGDPFMCNQACAGSGSGAGSGGIGGIEEGENGIPTTAKKRRRNQPKPAVFGECNDIRQNPIAGPPTTTGCGPWVWSAGLLNTSQIECAAGQVITVNWTPCCDMHDYCYDVCGVNGSLCDLDFGLCTDRLCNQVPQGCRTACRAKASQYQTAIQVGGPRFFRSNQISRCICCDPPNPHPLCPLAPVIPQPPQRPPIPQGSLWP